MSVEFIDIQTNSHERRTVSISYSDISPDTCYLLGTLYHITEFKRAELVDFARTVIAKFGIGEEEI